MSLTLTLVEMAQQMLDAKILPKSASRDYDSVNKYLLSPTMCYVPIWTLRTTGNKIVKLSILRKISF